MKQLTKTVTAKLPDFANVIGTMSFFVWTDSTDKDHHSYVAIPWTCAKNITPEDRETLHQLGKAIESALKTLHTDRLAKRNGNRKAVNK